MSIEREKVDSVGEEAPKGGDVAEHDRRLRSAINANYNRFPGNRRDTSSRASMIRASNKIPPTVSELDAALECLPLDVRTELVKMLKHTPSIGRVLVNNLPGREEQIAHAVRAGKAAGKASKTAMETKKIDGKWVNIIKKTIVDFSDVHPDFKELAHAAHFSEAGHYGIEHDDEHDEHAHRDAGDAEHQKMLLRSVEIHKAAGRQ